MQENNAIKGIDVSAHQGNIDWVRVKESGINFVIIRAGLGKFDFQVDKYFHKNISSAIDLGIPVGVYWYSYAITTEEAEQEANVCLRIINRYKSKMQLPVFFDQEYEPGILRLSNKARTDICVKFMETIKESGFKTGLYCSLDFWNNKLENRRLKSYPLWVASYSYQCSCYSQNLVAWQYSSRGRIKGISGNVDLNEGYEGLFDYPLVKSGWKQEGFNWFYYRDGVKLKNQWIKDGKWWYYLSENGSMLTGKHKIKGELFYLNEKREFDIPKGACIITDGRGVIK